MNQWLFSTHEKSVCVLADMLPPGEAHAVAHDVGGQIAELNQWGFDGRPRDAFVGVGDINPALKRQPITVGAGNLVGFGSHHAPRNVHMCCAVGDIECETDMHAFLGPRGDLIERVGDLHEGLPGGDANFTGQFVAAFRLGFHRERCDQRTILLDLNDDIGGRGVLVGGVSAVQIAVAVQRVRRIQIHKLVPAALVHQAGDVAGLRIDSDFDERVLQQ